MQKEKLKKKEWEKGFRFWDKQIWKSCNKLYLLGREYLSSVFNALRNTSKILHISQRVFFNPNCLHSDQ